MPKVSLDMPKEIIDDLKGHVGDDRKFVSMGFQGKGAGRKNGLGGNPPGVGSYLYWFASVSDNEPLSTGMHAYFNKILSFK